MFGADSLSETECCIATRQNKMAAPDVVSALFKKLNVVFFFLLLFFFFFLFFFLFVWFFLLSLLFLDEMHCA